MDVPDPISRASVRPKDMGRGQAGVILDRRSHRILGATQSVEPSMPKSGQALRNVDFGLVTRFLKPRTLCNSPQKVAGYGSGVGEISRAPVAQDLILEFEAVG